MVHASLAILLLQLVVATPNTPSVRGVVRSDAGGEPVAGAQVTALDTAGAPAAAAVSDAVGQYELPALPSGPHHLRFVAAGYRPLTMDVLLQGGATLRLDVDLAREPTALPIVMVRASVTDRPGDAPDLDRAWRVRGVDVRASPALDEPDLFRALAVTPTAQMTIESPTAVHVRGGSADQNVFLLDGAPVYSPVHAGRLVSAFSPDIVDELIVHGAAPPARYGGHLASVIDVRTPSAATERFTAGSFGSSAFGAATTVPLVRGVASLLVGARRSYSGVEDGDAAETAMPGSWLDGLAKLELHLRGTSVAISSFTADNGLGFAAGRGDARNRFEWSTTTSALAVERPIGGGAMFTAQLWHARFDAGATWLPDSSALALGNSLTENGASARVTVHRSRNELTVGVEAEQPRTRYDVRGHLAAADTVAVGYHLAAAPAITSVFVEESRRVGTRWSVRSGLRGTTASGLAPRLEPRLATSFDLSQRVTMSAAYARMHQYTQSLRNEESLVGTILGPDLLVAAGAHGVPAAESDELTVDAVASLGTHTRLRVEWYDRAMRGLVLVPPVTAAPFATGGFAAGRGRASGAGASAEWLGDRLQLLGSYGVATVDRSRPRDEYRVGFAPTQSATLAAGFRVLAHTTLRSTLAVTSERVTTTVADALVWDTRDPVSGTREITGTPNRAVGPLNGEPLPMYLRVDVGVRHTVPIFHGGSMTGFASVNNVLGRRNVTGYVLGGDAHPRALPMLPLTLVVGAAWRL